MWKCEGVSRPFASDTSPKRIDREGLRKRRTGTRQWRTLKVKKPVFGRLPPLPPASNLGRMTVNIPQPLWTLSSAEAFFVGWGERKRERVGHDGKGKAFPAFSFFPSFPALILFFDYCYIFLLGYPAGAFAEEKALRVYVSPHALPIAWTTCLETHDFPRDHSSLLCWKLTPLVRSLCVPCAFP